MPAAAMADDPNLPVRDLHGAIRGATALPADAAPTETGVVIAW